MASSSHFTPRKRAQAESSGSSKRRKIAWSSNRNIWNSADDWDTLVAESQLSTASISLRRSRPRGLQSLVCCATEACARSFKRIWEVPTPGGFVGQTVLGEYWKDGWAWVPDHLKADVRDKVFRYWGEYVTASMLSEVSRLLYQQTVLKAGLWPTAIDIPASEIITDTQQGQLAQVILAGLQAGDGQSEGDSCDIYHRCCLCTGHRPDAKPRNDQSQGVHFGWRKDSHSDHNVMHIFAENQLERHGCDREPRAEAVR